MIIKYVPCNLSTTCVYFNILQRPLCPTFPTVLTNTNLCTCVPCLDRSIKILAFLFWSLPLARRFAQARSVVSIPEYLSLSETSVKCYQHKLRNNSDERRPNVQLTVHTKSGYLQGHYPAGGSFFFVYCREGR